MAKRVSVDRLLFIVTLLLVFIGLVMVLEKTMPQPKALSYGIGLGLIGAGLYVAFV